MLKFILTSVLSLCLLPVSYAQAIKKDAFEIGPYEGVIRDSTLSKATLYNRSKQWVLSTFKSYDNNITVNDGAQDLLVTTPVINLEQRTFRGLAPTSINRCSFKLTLLFKEGRLKYEFATFSHQYTIRSVAANAPLVYDGSFANSALYKNKHEKMQAELDALLTGYIKELEKAVKGGAAKGDW
jgi:hypothetical protein